MVVLATGAPDLGDIISSLDRRVSNLEGATYIFGDPGNTNNPPLTITGLTATVVYSLQSGAPVSRVTWSWAAVTQNTEDLTTDLITDYMFSATIAGATQFAPYSSTNNTTTVTVDGLPLNTVVTGRVYALTKARIKGPIALLAVSVTKDTTPPLQPSTPVVASTFQGVSAAWDGLDVLGGAMPSDFNWTEVHASPTGPTFTPSTATFVDRLFAAGTSYIDVPSYALTYVRLVSVDAYGNAGVPSTAGSATPRKAVQTDLNIALPGDIAYRDEGNFVPDGSFESATMRASRVMSGSMSYINTAGFAKWGSWAMQITATDFAYLIGDISGIDEAPVTPGTKMYLRAWIRGISAVGTAIVGIRWTDSAGGTTYTSMSTTTSTGTYVLFESVQPVPATAITAAVYLQTAAMTAGTWYFDAIEFRKIMGTVLIEDAAITNAKIADLAVDTAKIGDLQVTDAKIGNLNVAKLTSGFLYADMTLSARLATALTGQRVELNWTGIQQYNSVGTNVVNIPSGGGAPYFRGTVTANLFRTDNSTMYIEMGDTGASDPTDELRMFNSGTVVSVRNPSAAPGRLRLSLGGGTKVDFWESGVYGQALMTAPGGSLKILAASNGLQARDAGDTMYVPFTCSSLTANGNFACSNITCDRITSPITYSSTTTGTVNALISTAGGLWRTTSSLRYKTLVEDEIIPFDTLMALRPKSWIDKGEWERNDESIVGLRRYMGLIAEEVAALPRADRLLVSYNLEDQPDSVDYDRVGIAMIPLVQDLVRRVTALEGSK